MLLALPVLNLLLLLHFANLNLQLLASFFGLDEFVHFAVKLTVESSVLLEKRFQLFLHMVDFGVEVAKEAGFDDVFGRLVALPPLLLAPVLAFPQVEAAFVLLAPRLLSGGLSTCCWVYFPLL